MRRLLAMIGITLASTAMLASFATPASAAAGGGINDVAITGSMHIVDDERRKDDIDDYQLDHAVLSLIDLDSEETAKWRQCHGGEIRVELDVTVSRITQKPGWVKVFATARLFEKTSCSNSDREDVETLTFDVAPNSEEIRTIHVETKERRSDDRADVRFTVKNHYKLR